ncbi:uncharacterized protein N7511_003494 [Penicillium nucicola]|uniref:uncharacterized protein n=1 Tax=Penicillium nucicola TaxID=1850975 RepID=UPI0025455CA9|nr:uncharacterized protein N7511_003494 [Penicillium nucicola]KAJ5771443.1 hypothetical protein N7511_003494 [Penicillium nucicola]
MRPLTCMILLAASATAAPIAIPFSKHFQLKFTGAIIQEHNNLYVYAYHTGAGTYDAALTKDLITTSSVSENGTKAPFNFHDELPSCVYELKKASREMGYEGNWKAALEEVKHDFVEPGKQTDLVRELTCEAISFVKEYQLVTVPPIAKETPAAPNILVRTRPWNVTYLFEYVLTNII